MNHLSAPPPAPVDRVDIITAIAEIHRRISNLKRNLNLTRNDVCGPVELAKRPEQISGNNLDSLVAGIFPDICDCEEEILMIMTRIGVRETSGQGQVCGSPGHSFPSPTAFVR